ncbi:hypothetical protein OSB04_020400 [Centaurea solstitialis]|uniref:Retrotransposon gag domain-containing protein n=1 Tax=Centaurea solstitialis TaxID=347529 RepID=A0AA38TAL1_9ASTR|nr:hypothetical protein OSB04_020400 [Centaurea solstitialis]
MGPKPNNASSSTNMGDRVEALEEAVITMEGNLRRSLDSSLNEFRETILADLAKLLERQQDTHPGSRSDDRMTEFRMAVKKVELPMFDGDDPVGWITRAEIYFDVQGTPENIKVKLAKLSMEGATIHWFNLLWETTENLTWMKFKQALIERYGGRQSVNPFEELKDLHQSRSVDDYITEFEYVSSQVSRLPEEQYLGYFLGGLRSEIRVKVRTFNPLNRIQAMKIARDVESELQGSVGPRNLSIRSWGRNSGGGTYGKGNFGSTPYPTLSRRNFGPGPSGGIVSVTKPNVAKQIAAPQLVQPLRTVASDRKENEKNRGVKHLPYADLMDRKAKGLCFRCGERYHPLHQCAERQLRMLILGDDEQLDEAGEIIAMEVTGEEKEETLECNSIGLCARGELQSTNTTNTIRIRGSVKGVPVEVLIDSGASHSFILPHVAIALDLAVESHRKLGVRLGDGHRVMTQGECKDVRLVVGDFETTVDTFVLEMGKLDMILGVSWLQKQGKVTFDWGERILLKEESQGRMFDFQRNNRMRFIASFYSVLFTKEKHNGLVEKSRLTDVQQEELETLLEQYRAIFQEGFGLPPQRETEHKIELRGNGEPISVRPYRYPHHHKNEIEKQVQEMLQQGIIRHNSSAF